MAFSFRKNTFDDILHAISANIERKKKIGNWVNKDSKNVANIASHQYLNTSKFNHFPRNLGRVKNPFRGNGRGNYSRGKRFLTRMVELVTTAEILVTSSIFTGSE